MKEHIYFFLLVLLIIVITTIFATFTDIVKWVSDYKMKESTKLKIIRWVERLIGYKHPPIQPFIIEERKVQIARFYHIYDKEEFLWLKEKDGLKRIIQLSIMEEITKTENAIQYQEEDAPEFGPNKVRVEAFMLFVVPKGVNDINLSQLSKKI